MMLTVFTPTYNRADLLPRVYKSLLRQSYTDFEWIIVDDGSTDATQQIAEHWHAENKIAMRYYKQVNGGKHRAINKGVSEAKGVLFFITDSDDYLPENALATVVNNYKMAKQKYAISGVAGRRMFDDGSIVGSDNFSELVCSSLDIRYRHKVSGDLVEVFETDILRKFPFPEIDHEKFCPEALVWNRIAQKHQLYFYNEAIYVTQYIAGGLTANSIKIRMNSPLASMLCYAELASYEIALTQKIRATINFWRFSFCSKISFYHKVQKVPFIFSILALPLGFFMHLNDLKNCK